MKNLTLFAALFVGATTWSQIIGTSFEQPLALSGQYTDTGDPNVAHNLLNNTGEPLVNYTSAGGEMGFKAKYIPYDTPDVGLTDGDFVGVTDNTPSAAIMFTDGDKGYQMSDLDGNFQLEFDQVNLAGSINPTVSLDFLLSINSTPTNGNYEGDGTVNASGSDRLRIFIKDITNAMEIDLFNSTGTDLDEFVPINGGVYQLEWQNITQSLNPNTIVQLVFEGRTNAGTEFFWLDNIIFDVTAGINNLNTALFSMYPNPASNTFVTFASKDKGLINVVVFDMLGKQVLNKILSNEKLDISILNSGIYIVKIEQGKNYSTKKLIVN